MSDARTAQVELARVGGAAFALLPAIVARRGARQASARRLRRADPDHHHRQGMRAQRRDVAAGKTTFKIKNEAARGRMGNPDGVMVVEERENIIPGFVQTADRHAQAGQYQMTCGLLSNPKGMLTVTATGTSTAKAEPSASDLVGPLAEYKVYVTREVGDLVAQTKAVHRCGKGRQARRRPRASTRRRASIMSGSSRWPNCSAISTRAWMPAPTISRRRKTIRPSAASTGSRRRCLRTRAPPAWRRWPTS